MNVPPSPQCSVPARYARLHYALGGGGKETKTTTNILPKVPNSFQDLTVPSLTRILLAFPHPRLSSPPANGCRVQTALPPGGSAPAGAVVPPARANRRLAAQAGTLGGADSFRPRRSVQGKRVASRLTHGLLLRPARLHRPSRGSRHLHRFQGK